LRCSVALLAAFVSIERRAVSPVIPLGLFGNPMVRAAALTGLFSGMAMFGAITYVPLFMQAVVGSSATGAGFVLTPFVFGWVACSIIGARLSLRLGYRPVVLAGMSMLTIAFALLASWGEMVTRLSAARDMVLAGIGMGLVFVPMLIAVQNSVPRAVLGSATSVTGFFRTIGGAVGVGLMGSVMAHRLHAELAALLSLASPALRPRLAAIAAHPDLVVNPLTRATLDAAALAEMRVALSHAVGAVFAVGLAISVLALASAFLVPAGAATDAIAREPATGGAREAR
jgi:predicted MFS family arabinose efflux permease